jgi:hypothetical protein
MSHNSVFKFRFAVLFGVTAVCVTTGLLVAHIPVSFDLSPVEGFTWIAALTLAVITWRTLRQRSPVGLLLVYGILGFGMAATLLYRPTTNEFTSINAVVARMAEHTATYRYLFLFTVGAFAIWCASMIVSIAIPRRQDSSVHSISIRLSPWMLVVAVLPLIATVYGTGLSVIFHAEHYLEHTGPHAAVSLGQALGPVGVLISGYFLFHPRQPTATRIFALLLAVAYEAVFLSGATRFFALWVPLVFAGAVLTGTLSPRRLRIGLLVAGVTAVFALQVPLGLRNLPNHGLVPGVIYILHQPSLVLTTHDPINNLLFGAPLTLYVANEVQALPSSDVVTSMSPLPSFLNNWSQIAPGLRVNKQVPFSAFGELLNHGWIFFVFMMAIFGAGFTLIERITMRQTGVVGGLGTMVVLGAAALFVVQGTEYNLRAAARLMYYAFVAVGILTVVAAQRRSRSSNIGVTAKRVLVSPSRRTKMELLSSDAGAGKEAG